jgi:hypothetical protein
MQANDKADFLKVLNGVALMRKAPLVPEVLELWWACMSDWRIEDFKAAAIHVLKTSAFMPTPKDFEDLRKAGRETAGEVFAGLRQWLKYTPNGYTLKPNTPRNIESAIRAMGGPNAYANCQEDKLPFLERRFCEHFETLQGATDTRTALPQLDVKRIAQT